MLTLTDSAVTKVKEIFAADAEIQGKCLRVGLEPGGCSGFQYAFSFDEKRPGDAELAFDGFKLVVDAQSAQHLSGAKIDYREDAASAGFKIENPNVKKSCGCGQSNQF